MSQPEDNRSHQEQVNRAETTEKQEYHTPELREFGTLEELTRTNTTFATFSDGGALPNIYTGTA